MKKMRMLIDIIMLIVLILVYNVAISGVLLHEILGILIWILFLIHLGLNYKWIKMITKNFNYNIKKEIKRLYIIDLLLIINFIIITISGIGISQYIFTFFNVKDISIFTNIHKIASYFSIFLLSLHMLMHFKFFNNQFNKIIKSNEKSKIITIIFLILSITLLSFSSISLKIKKLFINKIDETEYNGENIKEDTEEVLEQDTSDETESEVVSDTNQTNDATVVADEEEEPTLLEYLGKLVCTGCGRRCPLSHPQCNRGESKAESATADYNEMYS